MRQAILKKKLSHGQHWTYDYEQLTKRSAVNCKVTVENIQMSMQ